MHRTKTPQTWLQRLENLHPYETLLYLGMLGSGLVFLFLVFAFLGTDTNQPGYAGRRMPVAFLVSTLVLVLSGFVSTKMRLNCKDENIPGLESSLRNVFFLGLIFTLLQVAGWRELTLMGIPFNGLPSGSYLYVLSGIHIFHLCGAMVFAVILLVRLRKTQEDDVQKLIWVTNPFEKMRIRLFTVYWHFMGLVWLALFLVFVFRL